MELLACEAFKLNCDAPKVRIVKVRHQRLLPDKEQIAFNILETMTGRTTDSQRRILDR